MVFFDYGCCRFDQSKYNAHGYLTIDQCFEKCNSDTSCVAADLARPQGNKYDCFTWEGFDGFQQSLRTECGKKRDEKCYARLKPTSKHLKEQN